MSAGGGSFGGDANSAWGGSNVFGTVGNSVGSVFGGLTGATQVASATGQAANAQLAGQQSDRTQAMSYAAPTAAEMQNLQQSIDTNNQQIQQGQQLVNSASPALQEAASQALQLMSGNQQASSLSAINNSRATQRSQLQQQLQQQLGSGYATSSAGIQALNNFDQQTSNLLNTAQQSAIGQYLGEANAGYQLGAAQQQSGSNGLLSANNQSTGWRNNQLSAFMNSTVNPGLAYSGQIANAQAQSNFGLNGIFGSVGTILGSGGGNAAKGTYSDTGGGYEGSSAQQAANNAYGSYNNSIFGSNSGGGGGGGVGLLASLL